MTVRTLLIAGALTFFALLATAFATTVLLIGDGSGGARSVGLTNRQGMLSQKVAKEALAYARSPTPDVLTQLRTTMQIFSVTHRALRFGGPAPLDLDGQNFEDVTAATDPELRRLLKDASDLWNEIGDAIEALILAAQQRTEALAQVELKNPRLMRKMNEVTQLLAQRELAAALRVAAHQGVMAERTVKEALLYDAAPNAARREQLVSSIAAFERGHDALRRGRTLRSSNGRYPAPIRPTPPVAEKLDEAKWLWIDQAEALTRLASEEGEYHRAVATITETNPKLLEALGEAAVRADWVAARNLRRLETVQLVVLSLGLAIAILAIVIAVRIGASLRKLRDVADAISRGDVDSSVAVVGIGEVRDLSRAFERMRLSLRKAMELLERTSMSQRPESSSRSSRPR